MFLATDNTDKDLIIQLTKISEKYYALITKLSNGIREEIKIILNILSFKFSDMDLVIQDDYLLLKGGTADLFNSLSKFNNSSMYNIKFEKPGILFSVKSITQENKDARKKVLYMLINTMFEHELKNKNLQNKTIAKNMNDEEVSNIKKFNESLKQLRLNMDVACKKIEISNKI